MKKIEVDSLVVEILRQVVRWHRAGGAMISLFCSGRFRITDDKFCENASNGQ